MQAEDDRKEKEAAQKFNNLSSQTGETEVGSCSHIQIFY
jgi:hypothetical protein